jgi:hypothetical protein
MVEDLPSMLKALGSILNTARKKTDYFNGSK